MDTNRDAVKRNVNCSGIEFDSEYSQFFAYAKTRTRLESFAKQIAKHYEKAKELTEKMY
jgi:type II secretory pathway component PulF